MIDVSEPVEHRHDFLENLSERHRATLLAQARPFTAAPGEILAAEGKDADRFLLVQKGHVGLWQHCPAKGTVPVQTVGPGEVVGWSWLLPPHRWQFDCRAVDEVQGLEVDGKWLRDLCERDTELGYRLVKQLVGVIANRLAATRLQLLDIYK